MPVEGRQMPSDSHEKDFVSQGKMNAKGIRKSKKVESGKNNTTKAKFDRDSKGVLTRNALNQTDKIIAGKNSLSEKAKAFGVKTKRKLAYVSKDSIFITSVLSLCRANYLHILYCVVELAYLL